MICSRVFVKKHSTVTMKVLNDFISAIDSSEYRAAFFLFFQRCLTTVDHYILAQRLVDIVMSPKAVTKCSG